MPFIRLSDNYIDDPKIMALSDGAFRLWHEGMAYSRKHQTDGLIPFATMRGFRYFTKAREKQVTEPFQPGEAPLWELVRGFGYRIHNYLFWNLSKDEERSENAAATARMRRLRAKRKAECSPTCSGEQAGEQSPNKQANVQDRIGTGSSNLEKGSGEKPFHAPDGRSKRPIFTGQRLTVFEWQLDDCMRLLGAEANNFDLHEWFFSVDRLAVDSGLVIPKRDGGAWLEAQLVAECQRRGINLRMATVQAPTVGKLTQRMGAMVAAAKREAS